MRSLVVPLAIVTALASSGLLSADCYEMVEVGDPGYVVIEKCGEPLRRERMERPAAEVEIIRGQQQGKSKPLQSLIIEKWYYDGSLNSVTVLQLEDTGVMAKERLQRQE